MKYEFDFKKYPMHKNLNKIKDLARDLDEPMLFIDLEIIKKNYIEMKKKFLNAKIFYAIKANPDKEILKILIDLGSCFDIASIYELDRILSLGATPNKISYGNTIKKERDIKYFYDKGINLFTSDSENDIKKLARVAPGSKIIFRILVENDGADWPLSKKFGAHTSMIINLVKKAKKLDLCPYGISFHVGSQQRDIRQWNEALQKTKFIFETLKEDGIILNCINLGGGFPANYLNETKGIHEYSNSINDFLSENFDTNLDLIVEPGRSLVADAGLIVSEIILISKKANTDLESWVYLDIGLFSGLIECLQEAIKYPIYFDKEGINYDIVLAGPTCDSMDILYQYHKYKMPSSSKEGDKVYIFTTGAYTQSYSSIEFNGFPPLKSTYL